MNNIVNQAKEVFEAGIKRLGLDSFKVEIFSQPQAEDFIIALSTKVNYFTLRNGSPEEVVAAFIDPIIADIEKSEYVRHTTQKQADEIESLTKKVKELQTELNQLQPYKQYYDLAYELNHGTERTKNKN